MANVLPASPILPEKRTERLFFSTYSLVLLLLIFAGFAPSFYLRGIAPPYGPLRPLRVDIVVHAILAATFVLAFPLQTWLIATNRRLQHALVGKYAFVLGALMLPAGYWIAVNAYHHAQGLPPGIGPAAIIAGPLPDLVVLAFLLWFGWRKRFDAQAHKRFMILIACGLADPAISRLPLWGAPPLSFVLSNVAVLATVIPMWVWDVRTRRAIHWATVLGSGLLLVKLSSRLLFAPTEAWAAIVYALPGFGVP